MLSTKVKTRFLNNIYMSNIFHLSVYHINKDLGVIPSAVLRTCLSTRRTVFCFLLQIICTKNLQRLQILRAKHGCVKAHIHHSRSE